MGSEWPTVVLSEVAELQGGYAFKSKDWQDDGVPVVKIANVLDGRIDLSTCSHVSQAVAASAGKWALRAGDILVGMTGYVGAVGRMQASQLPALLNQRVGRFSVRDPSRLDADFLFLALGLPRVRTYWKSFATGSAQANISGKQLVSAGIPLPALDEQRRIAAVLGPLDDKIELNRKMNRTLEEMAQAIFKSWFIDFDGVPDSELVESELGPIPRGWAIGRLTSLASYLRRGLSPKYTEEGGVRVINQKCIRHFRVDLSKARRHDPTKRKIDGRVLEAGDVLINSTGVGTLGRVAQLPAHDETLICDSHVTVVRAGPETSSLFLGASLMHLQPQIESLGHGSTGQTELRKKDLERLVLVVPPSSRQRDFEGTIRPLKQKMLGNERQSGTLTGLRDALLPKLISGEIRVPEAEEAVEAAL